MGPHGRLASIAMWTGVWTVVCAIFAMQTASRVLMRGQRIDWFSVVGLEALYWAPWAALTPVLIAAARRWPFDGAEAMRNIARHLGVMVVVGVTQVSLALALQLGAIALRQTPPGGMATVRAAYVSGAPGLLIMACWKYWVVIGIWAAFASMRRLRQRELRAAQLEGQLATAQLRALKAQLHPHFLFNALHSVSMLNLIDVDAANRVLAQLSDLLRSALEQGDTLDVPLAREIELLDQYLAIERVRFEERLRVEVRLADEVRHSRVPTLILQPLVENALRHGLSKLARGGRLAIRAYRSLDSRNGIVLEVEDDGPGLPPGWSMATAGLGLANVRDRLRVAYGQRATLELMPVCPHGVLARLTLPAVV